jgi:hypothetical protein
MPRATKCRRKNRGMLPPATLGPCLGLRRRGLNRWKDKEHNTKWWRRIDGTPIPNDLPVNIAEVI